METITAENVKFYFPRCQAVSSFQGLRKLGAQVPILGPG